MRISVEGIVLFKRLDEVWSKNSWKNSQERDYYKNKRFKNDPIN